MGKDTVLSRFFLSSRYFLCDGTVPSRYFLRDGTVSSRYFLHDSTVPSPSHYPIFMGLPIIFGSMLLQYMTLCVSFHFVLCQKKFRPFLSKVGG